MRLATWLSLAWIGLVACSKSPPAPAEPAEPAAPLPGEAEVASNPSPKGSNAMLYDIPIKTLSGKPTTLGEYRGRALLLVNVASECGLTPQYEQLQEVYEKYKDRGLVVVGFPCNQFGAQEPGSPEQIQQFCKLNYGVTFPLMEKIEVNGAGRHGIYDILTRVPDGAGQAGDIQWNFEKFVVSADGETVVRFRPKVRPDDPQVIAAIEEALPD